MMRRTRTVILFCSSTLILTATASLGSLDLFGQAVPSGSAAGSADYSKEPVVVERILYKFNYENDGTSNIEMTARVRVQSQAGVHVYGMLQYSYASASSSVEIKRVQVTKPDHRVVQTPAENVLEMPAEVTRDAPFYSDIKVKQIAVKGLEIGDTLEYDFVERVTRPIIPGEFWLAHDFVRGAVVLDEGTEVSIPRERYVNVKSAIVQPTITEKGAYKIYSWKTAQLEATASKKDSQESDDTKQPDIRLTTLRTWDDLGKWTRSLYAPQAAPTPEVKAKALELTRDAKTDEQKIRFLYNYVSQKFRYISISWGVGRYQPHAARDVLDNDYGDCKDKHTLFAALLAAIGVKAYPALMNSARRIDPEVPSPQQFDHMITAIPQEKGFLFLDTTAEVAPFGMLVQTLRDKNALVIPETGAVQFVDTPADPPVKEYFHFSADGSLDSAGTLESKMSIETRGDVELGLRLVFRRAGQPEWKGTLQKLSQNLGFGGTVDEVTVTPPEQTDVPFKIDYRYERKEYSDWADKQILPPFPPIRLVAVPDEPSEKPKPLKIGTPTDIDLSARLKLPEGSRPAIPSPVHLDEIFGEYRSTYSYAGDTLVVHRSLGTKVHEIPVAQIPAYKKFLTTVVDDESKFIPLFGGETSAQGSGVSFEAQSLLAQGRAAAAQGDPTAAANAFQAAVRKDPNYAEAWFALGAVHLMTGDTDQGVSEIKKGIAINPKDERPYQYLANGFVHRRKYDEAIQVWKELEKADPANEDAKKNIALLLSQAGRDSEAVPALEDALKAEPDDPELLFSLGSSYLGLDEKEKALAALHHAVDADKTGGMLNEVAWVLADKDIELQTALEYSQKSVAQVEDDTAKIKLGDYVSLDAFNLMPRLVAYWDTLGWVYFRLGDYAQAEKYLNAAWMLGLEREVAEHLDEVEAEREEGSNSRGRAEKHRDYDSLMLQALRSIVIPQLAKKHASAECIVLFSAGPKVVDAQCHSDSDELHDAARALTTAKFNVPFPDDGPTQIVRRGILDCEPQARGCQFVLIPLNGAPQALKR